jgi:hypothetical protein
MVALGEAGARVTWEDSLGLGEAVGVAVGEAVTSEEGEGEGEEATDVEVVLHESPTRKLSLVVA